MTRYIYNDIEVEVSGQDLLDMFREVDNDGVPMNDTVRLEVNENGESHFANANEWEDRDTVYTQIYERDEWLEDPNEEVIMEYWVHALNEFYHNNPIEIDTEYYTEENEDGEEEYVEEYTRLLIKFF